MSKRTIRIPDEEGYRAAYTRLSLRQYNRAYHEYKDGRRDGEREKEVGGRETTPVRRTDGPTDGQSLQIPAIELKRQFWPDDRSHPPDRTWRRPPGRPRNKWLDQLRDDSTSPVEDLWGRAVGRGHAVVQGRDGPRRLRDVMLMWMIDHTDRQRSVSIRSTS